MPFSAKKAVELINREIQDFKSGTSPAELYDPIAYFMGIGGKRLRPLLTLYGSWLFTEDWQKHLKPALAVEMFHNFTLMHDDIMDKAPLRRNKQTVHEKWNSNTAILSGDVMLVKAYEIFGSTEGPNLQKVLANFNICAAQVCEGQQLDMNFESRDKVSEQEYLGMIKLKTAVLLGFSLETGALLSGAPHQDALFLRECGTNAGIAFQLKDDLLDVYGDQEKFGKLSGGDILANKKTFLLIKALELAKGADGKVLKGLLTDNKVEPDKKIETVKSIYDKLQVRLLTEKKIEEYFEKALANLNAVKAPLVRKGALKRFFKELAEREQ